MVRTHEKQYYFKQGKTTMDATIIPRKMKRQELKDRLQYIRHTIEGMYMIVHWKVIQTER